MGKGLAAQHGGGSNPTRTVWCGVHCSAAPLQAARRRGGASERVHGHKRVVRYASSRVDACQRRTTPLGPAIAVHLCTQCACRDRPRRRQRRRAAPCRCGMALPMLDIRERNRAKVKCQGANEHVETSCSPMCSAPGVSADVWWDSSSIYQQRAGAAPATASEACAIVSCALNPACTCP